MMQRGSDGEIGERVKAVRKALGLTQQKFADALHISRNNIATYEIGKASPGDPTIALVSRTFNANEQWLRTGEGEMLKRPSHADEQQVGRFLYDVFSGGQPFKRELVLALPRLDDADWRALERIARKLLGGKKED